MANSWHNAQCEVSCDRFTGPCEEHGTLPAGDCHHEGTGTAARHGMGWHNAQISKSFQTISFHLQLHVDGRRSHRDPKRTRTIWRQVMDHPNIIKLYETFEDRWEQRSAPAAPWAPCLSPEIFEFAHGHHGHHGSGFSFLQRI